MVLTASGFSHFALCIVVLIAAVPGVARAQFVDAYTLTPPAAGVYGIYPTFTTPFGGWAAVYNAGGQIMSVDTTGAPDVCRLNIASSARPNSYEFASFAAGPGLVQFDYRVVGENGGSFKWFHGGVRKVGSGFVFDLPLVKGPLVTNIDGVVATASFTVQQGERFGFTIGSEGRSVIGPIPMAIHASRTVTISNFHGPETPLALECLPPSGNLFQFQFLTSVGHAYRVEYQQPDSGPEWFSLTNVVAGPAASSAIITDAISGSSRFYRVLQDPTN